MQRHFYQGRFYKVALAVLCIAQSIWLYTPKPAVCQSTPTLHRLKPILDTSNSGASASPSTSGTSGSSTSTYGTAGSSNSNYGGSSYDSSTSATPTYGSNYGSTGSNSYSSNSSSQYNAQPASTAYGANKSSSKSKRVDDLMAQGLQAHAAGNSAAAESLFRQALKLDSKNIDIYYNLGALAEERGDYTEALQDYQSGLHLDPSDQDLKTAYATATQKLQQLNYSKQLAATQAQEQAKAAQQTDQLKLLGAQAASAYHAGKYDQAIKDLQSVAAQRPNDPDVQYALAQAYRQKKDYKQAADHINRAIAIVPSNPQYQQLLSSILAEKNGKASSSSMAQGVPPAAPGYNRGNSGDLYSGNSYGNNSNSGAYGQTTASNGGIVPFTPDATEAPPGYNSGIWGQGGNSNGGYYNSGSGYNSSRVRRMLTGALIGATAGGLVGSMFHPSYGYGYGGYGRSSGMMSGALWGGMAGLIFGGIR